MTEKEKEYRTERTQDCAEELAHAGETPPLTPQMQPADVGQQPEGYRHGDWQHQVVETL